jgi:hypothetical protein
LTEKEPHDPSPPFALAYPIAFFGGVLLLCAWILNGIHHPTYAPAEHAPESHEEAHAP